MILQSIQQQSIGISQMSPIDNKLEVLVDVSTDSIYWFQCYKSSDFPMMTWEREYFFLWSTDHDQINGGSVYWGDGDYPDLRDFRERGEIVSGYQSETPYPYNYNNTFYLFYHTIATNPINTCGGQETNLISATSGVLHTATWTQEPNPFGCQGTVDGIAQGHTGYAKVWNLNGNITSYHYFKGVSPPYNQKSFTTRFDIWQNDENLQQGYNVFLSADRIWLFSWATPFYRGNQLWCFINSGDSNGSISSGLTPSAQLHLVKITPTLEITELVHTFTDDEQQGYMVSVIGDTAHCYRQTGRPDEPQTFNDFLSYSFLDLTFLDYL